MGRLIRRNSGEGTKNWSFDRRLPLVDQVFADIRRRIVSLELPPNHSVSRLELSAYYGVSQTPLRDAIRKLESEGLLEIYPQSKTLVSRFNMRVVRETQFLRTAVEVEIAAQLAEDPDKSNLGPAEAVHERLIWALEHNSPHEEFSALDKEFHRNLYLAADKVGLFGLIDARSGHLDRLRHLHLRLREDNKSKQVTNDHAKILGAILASDVVAAKAVMREHLTGTLQRLDALREGFPEFFE